MARHHCPTCGAVFDFGGLIPDHDHTDYAGSWMSRWCSAGRTGPLVRTERGVLGPKDYLIQASAKVHLMRYGGRNEDGHQFWRTACGSGFSDEAWGMAWYPSPGDIEWRGLAACRRCFVSEPTARVEP